MKRISYTRESAPDKFENEYGWKGACEDYPWNSDNSEYHLEQNLIGKSGNDWYENRTYEDRTRYVLLNRMQLFNFLNVCFPSLLFKQNTISMLKPDFVKKNFDRNTYEDYTKNKKSTR